MVCPKCKMEYEDWVRECSDCNVPLVTDRELAEIEEEKRRQRQEERERKIQGKMEVSAEDIRKWGKDVSEEELALEEEEFNKELENLENRKKGWERMDRRLSRMILGIVGGALLLMGAGVVLGLLGRA